MSETTIPPAVRAVRWIIPAGHDQPIPAWQGDDGGWLLAGGPRRIPPGTHTHQLIEAADVAHTDGLAIELRCLAAVADFRAGDIPADLVEHHALTRCAQLLREQADRCTDDKARTVRAQRVAVVAALLALCTAERAAGRPGIADRVEADVLPSLADQVWHDATTEVAQHENALHVGRHEPGRPECEREQAEADGEDEVDQRNAKENAETGAVGSERSQANGQREPRDRYLFLDHPREPDAN